MTRFWQRRIAVVTIVTGASIVALYALSFFITDKHTSSNLGLNAIMGVGVYAAIAGAIALITGLYTFFATHPEDLAENARLDYLITLGALTTLIYTTGIFTSPFAIFWGAIALAAPLFGAWGIIPVTIIALGVPALGVMTGDYKIAAAWAPAAVALAPMLFGLMIKPISNTKSAETEEDKSYSALARQLGQVASKSEVVINAIGEGVLAVDGQGVIDLINPAAVQLVGWGANDAVGLSYKSILKLVDSRGNELDSAHDPVAITFASNKPTGPGEFALLTQSDKSILVSVIVSPIGQPGSGAIIVFRNISNERAEERQQAEFISTASHEMRTPVASIEGYLGLALNPQTAQIDDKARDFINKAHEAAQHLGRLFQDLLDVSKAEDGRMQNNPKIVDVSKFMSDIVEGLRPKAEQKGLKLIFKPQIGTGDMHEKGIGRTIAPVFYVNVDNDHLREVGDNLVENAIKYTLSGEVVVDVTGTDQHVTISIADTGLGIPREDQVHLFQKFYRVDNSDTREIGGTGLGLYLCRRLVESMNGRIWVDSAYKKGSTFYVELPRTSSVDANTMIQQAELQTEQTSTATPSSPIIDKPQVISVMPPDTLVASIASTEPAPALFSVPAAPVAPSQPYANAEPSANPPAVQAPLPPAIPQPMQIPSPLAAPAAAAPQRHQTDMGFEPVLVNIPESVIVQPDVPHPISDFPNVQLSAIEKDPERYIAQTEGRALNIPTRNP